MVNNIIIPKYNNKGVFLRQIRSFVIRNKKINDSGIEIIRNVFPILGLSFKIEKINFDKIFNTISPVVLEIGFGTGKTLVDTALKNNKKNFLGIEVHQNSLLKCLKYAHFKKIKNLKVIYHDAEEVMLYMIRNRTLSKVQIFFPDPWHKKKHYKRRLLKKNFINLILKKLVLGGTLHVATDCQSYADNIVEIINYIPGYKNLSETNTYIVRPKNRPVTKFEKKAIILNKVIFDLFFEKII
ncbi:tRNA (guanosine(46)-N7)-methyltransferase TrmB [Buchnera aphidicola (Pemphigus obesinymphae)]|uniref:tRNA (guanosine(46)-N7)-methyltransferase TrmB n=1 Tax=Buchnera aphidicola TaxID=9 RepID=UPI002237426A|nr:tRNA (guanosine(46)-N7)-methyltransferase TrmB [Buchnera aphidicola]MCW5196448.1 tRNA (guanosine(46)-N7)-methyltransferase TrmB [Buchnera aphidicola (Pemphigus obesinymphae)]